MAGIKWLIVFNWLGGDMTFKVKPAGIIQGLNLLPLKNLIFGAAVKRNWLWVAIEAELGTPVGPPIPGTPVTLPMNVPNST